MRADCEVGGVGDEMIGPAGLRVLAERAERQRRIRYVRVSGDVTDDRGCPAPDVELLSSQSDNNQADHDRVIR